MAFLGMRGSGDWAPNERPENWREMILFLYPNGDAPLTAINSRMASESTDDPIFHWWTKELPEQGGAVSGFYTDAQLSNEITSGDGDQASGTTVYAKVAEETATEFRQGHTALIHDDGEFDSEAAGQVKGVGFNGADSYIAITLDQTAPEATLISSNAQVDVTGSAHAEGAEMPDSVGYDPEEFENFTQIWRTPLSITRTARRTRLRTGDAYQERKRETLELHAIEMEKSSLWGVKTSKIGPNGKPKRTTQGVIPYIKEHAPENADSFLANSNYTGTWEDEGWDWMNTQLERLFRYGQTEKLGLCGNMALLGLQELAKVTADININPMTVAFGMRVIEWVTPFGTLFLRPHPLFNRRPMMRNNIVVLEPENMRFRFVDDTFFVDDPEDTRNRNNSRDATEEEYITEGGYEFHHPKTFGFLADVGKDN